MAARTNLNIMDLSSIFQSLSTGKRSGLLKVTCDEDQKIISFNMGNIEQVSAVHRKTMLGEALMKYGKITEEQLEKALSKQSQLKMDIGSILLDMKVVTPEDIKQALLFQITEDICEIFALPSIHCEFNEGHEKKRPHYHGVTISVNPEILVMEAARRIDEYELLKKILPSTKDVFIATPASFHYFEEYQEDSPEQEVLSLVDGVRDINEVIDKARLTRFDTLKVLYKLAINKEIEVLSAEKLIHLAINNASHGFVKKSLLLFERAEELGIKNIELQLNLAKAYEETGTTDKAIEKYKRYAEECEQAGKLEDSALAYKKIVTLDAQDTDSHIKLLNTFIQLKQGKTAVHEAAFIVEKFLSKRDEASAIAIWQRVEDAFSDMPEPYRNLADLHISYGRTAQAIVELEYLAALYLLADHKEEAVSVYREMLRLDKECLQARLSLAGVLADAGQIEDAVCEYNTLADILSSVGMVQDSTTWAFLAGTYEKIASLEPRNISARKWLARAYEENKNFIKSAAIYHEIVAIYREMGNTKEIILPLTKIAEFTPDDMSVREELAKLYNNVNEGKKASKEYQRIIRAAIQEEDFNRALEYANIALEIDPLDLECHKALSAMYRLKGDKENEKIYTRKVAYLEAVREKYKDCASALESVFELQPDSIELQLNLASIYEMAGDSKNSLKSYLSIAKWALANNNLGLAKEFSEKVLSLDNKNKEIEKLLYEISEREALLSKSIKIPVIEKPVIIKESSYNMEDEEFPESQTRMHGNQSKIRGTSHNKRR
ncbi:MAG: DUF4388 domain-containing protein [Planctomycetota bacterium]